MWPGEYLGEDCSRQWEQKKKKVPEVGATGRLKRQEAWTRDKKVGSSEG